MSYHGMGAAPPVTLQIAPLKVATSPVVAPPAIVVAPMAKAPVQVARPGAFARIDLPPECVAAEALMMPAGLAELLRIPSAPNELKNRDLVWAWASTRTDAARALSDRDMVAKANAIASAWVDKVKSRAYKVGDKKISDYLDSVGGGFDPITRTIYLVVEVRSERPETKAVLTGARTLWGNAIAQSFGFSYAALTAEGILPRGHYTAKGPVAQAAAALIGGAVDTMRAGLIRLVLPTTRRLLPGPTSESGMVTAAIAYARGAVSASEGAGAAADAIAVEAPGALGLAPEEGYAMVAGLRSRLQAVEVDLDKQETSLNAAVEQATKATTAPTVAERLAAKAADPNTPNALVAEVRQKISALVPAIERDFPDELRRKYLVCQLWRNAATVDIPSYMEALARAASEAAAAETAFKTEGPGLLAAAAQAIAGARQRIAAAQAILAEVESKLDLPWYAKRILGLPVWGWGAIGAVTLVGGAVVIKKLRGRRAVAPSPVVANRRRRSRRSRL